MSASPETLPRGACPTLETPMAVGDGLLARMRPTRPMSAAQWRALGRIAAALGNGRVDVTSRASLQVRGLTPTTAASLPERLDAAGLAWTEGLVAEVSGLAGLDSTAKADGVSLLAALEPVLAAARRRLTLAPKLSLVIDDGGTFGMGLLSADICLRAVAEGRWQIVVAGRNVVTRATTSVPAEVEALLVRLHAIGPMARARDLDPVGARAEISQTPPTPGQVRTTDGRTALLFAPRLGQAGPDTLAALAEAMEKAGIRDVAPAPHRLLIAVAEDTAISRFAGLLDPAFFAVSAAPTLPLCVGAERAGEIVVHSPDLARDLMAAVPQLADGTVHLHTSSCVKGCPHRGAAGLRLGTADGAMWLFAHPGGTQPLAPVGRGGMEGAAFFAQRFFDSHQPGESAAQTLARLAARRPQGAR